ncbi:MAG: FAD-dependent thymidylate synthase [Thermodesulfovibrionales bacterium]|jgi:thymidylate synthase (FAD)
MSEAQLKVILLTHTPNPEETVAMAARLCYSPSDIEALKEKTEGKDQRAFVEKLMAIGHMSPIEHASFTFAVEGISRACSHQLVRHRLASYSQQSQRYVSESGQKSEDRCQKTEEIKTFDYLIPPSIAGDAETKKAFEEFMAEAQKAYDLLMQRLNERGIKGEAASQDARFVLPNAAETKIMLTMNARELLHFFRQRCCNRAQWEIRAMADAMLRLAKKAAPVIFSQAGPGCVSAPCPEGSFTCGKIEEVRKKYRGL